MARARGANAIMAGVFESTYGTAPGSGFKKLPFVSSALGLENGLIASDLLGYGREPLDPTPDVLNNEGSVVVPVDLRNFGNWLKLMTGAPTSTTVSAVTTHVFASGATALPSMSIEVGLPEVPTYAMNKGVRGNSMKISMQRSGLLTAEMQLIAQNEVLNSSSGAGSTTAAAVKRFAQAKGAITQDGDALASVVSADFTLMNNLDKVEVIRPDSLIEDADPGMVGASGNITVRFKDTALLDQATAGTASVLTFGWETEAGADESLLFTINNVFLPRAKRPVQGPGGIQASFAWQASRDPSTGKTFLATLVNDVASY